MVDSRSLFDQILDRLGSSIDGSIVKRESHFLSKINERNN